MSHIYDWKTLSVNITIDLSKRSFCKHHWSWLTISACRDCAFRLFGHCMITNERMFDKFKYDEVIYV